MRTVWEFRGLRLVSSDGTPETLWADYLAFLALWETRSTHPTYVRMVAAPFTADKVLWTLGPGDSFEQFQLDSIHGGPDPKVPSASWQTIIYLESFIISAVKRGADTNGMVGFEQRMRVSYPEGRARYELDTTITTKPGTDARTKAATYGAIDITMYPNGTYAEACNGPDGIEYTTEDSDEPNDRVPTVCRARSVVDTWDVHVGAAGGGTAPSEVDVETRTTTSTTETTTVRTASAVGPGAAAWVAGWELSGWSLRVVDDKTARGAYSITWTRKDEAQDAEAANRLRVSISGGRAVQMWRSTPGGFDPVLAEGGRLPWEVRVSVEVVGHGLDLTPADLPLPALLAPGAHGLILDGNDSRETLPELDPTDPQMTRWVRAAELVYRGPLQPPADILSLLRAGFGAPVPSYGLAGS
ncbi:MAG: hypothetical protein KC656_15175 [Myxococcales bacterium]|nr:hypothetical protein [Myxococcales bacterium]